MARNRFMRRPWVFWIASFAFVSAFEFVSMIIFMTTRWRTRMTGGFLQHYRLERWAGRANRVQNR